MITIVFENYDQYQKALKKKRYFRFRLSDKVKTINGQVGTIRRKHRTWPNLPKDWLINGLSQEIRDTIDTDSIFRAWYTILTDDNKMIYCPQSTIMFEYENSVYVPEPTNIIILNPIINRF